MKRRRKGLISRMLEALFSQPTKEVDFRRPVIKDSAGHLYNFLGFEKHGVTKVQLYRNGVEVAHAKIAREKDAYLLGDLLVASEWRRKGIGSFFLAELEKEMKRASARRVYGNIGENDLRLQPGLKEWYAKRGYVVGPARESGFVAYIERQLC